MSLFFPHPFRIHHNGSNHRRKTLESPCSAINRHLIWQSSTLLFNYTKLTLLCIITVRNSRFSYFSRFRPIQGSTMATYRCNVFRNNVDFFERCITILCVLFNLIVSKFGFGAVDLVWVISCHTYEYVKSDFRKCVIDFVFVENRKSSSSVIQ